MLRKRFILTILFTFIMQVQIYALDQPTSPLSIKIDLFKSKLYVIEDNQIKKVFPVAIGTEMSPTPVGQFEIIEKSKAWGGGFGSRWLGLDVPWGIYGIHGTNKPYLIGENVSSGCIRMHNADVETLYEMVDVGTVVLIDGPLTGSGEGEFKSLSLGSRGNLVQLVQNRLKAIGIYDGDLNGVFGIKTELAVKDFQKMHDISINGVISFREYLLLGLLE